MDMTIISAVMGLFMATVVFVVRMRASFRFEIIRWPVCSDKRDCRIILYFSIWYDCSVADRYVC